MFFKTKYKKRNEIIICPYNLPEMVNVANNLNFKIVYSDINYTTGFFDIKKLTKKINKKTCAVLLTNMFNSYEDTKKIKKICNKKKIFLIEDNAIYFDNYSKKGKNNFNSGSLGDFSIYSFNIMKNISALFGGAVTTNNLEFYQYANQKLDSFNNFPIRLLLKQSMVFFILKILSNNFLYKVFFFRIIRISHIYNIKFFLKLFYPSLKFKKMNFPTYYFSKMSNLSKKLVSFQLLDLNRRKENFSLRKLKNIYYEKKFRSLKSKNLELLNITDFNYQNFIDFPILVNNRKKLNHYLLKYGIESRIFYYNNCEKIFTQKTSSSKNSELYERKIICFPNHRKISKVYMDYIIKKVKNFYDESSSDKY
tara:strand:+ start:435 stop:1529 length:1095 start_codon:yes stop_codon:yes gene_type:complete